MIERLFETMYRKLVIWARYKLHDQATAEDVIQSVFEEAQKRKSKLLFHPDQIGWLYRTARNKILHEYRARFRFNQMLDKLETRIINSQNVEDESAMPDPRLEVLTERELDMLTMLYSDKTSVQMVADKYGLSYRTCQRHVQKAKDKLLCNEDKV